MFADIDPHERLLYSPFGHSGDGHLLGSKSAIIKSIIDRKCYPRSSCRNQSRIHVRGLENERSLGISNMDHQIYQYVSHEDNNHNVASIITSLTRCAQQRDIHTGLRIHMDLSRSTFLESNIFIGTALVNLYAKCGALQRAQEVFDGLPTRNEVTWTALLSGYAQFGCIEEAFKCFEQMKCEGISPNEFTFSSILKACAISKDFEKGQQIHTYILKGNVIAENLMVGNALVDMYSKCGALEKAQGVFDELHTRDVVSWNTLITGYTQDGQARRALECFDQMQQAGFSPNTVTFMSILKACGSIRDSDRGEAIHSLIRKECTLETQAKVANSLVDMYIRCDKLEKAQETLNQVRVYDVLLWTTIITGYTQRGLDNEALYCFQRMQSEGCCPDAFTFSSILKACANVRALKKGQEVHAQLYRMLVMNTDKIVASALVDMYAKCGALEKAKEVFEEFSSQGVVLWNALISALAHHDLIDETWKYFERMYAEGCCPDEVTFACILRVSGDLDFQDKSQKVLAAIVRHGMHESSKMICVALLNMYARDGMIKRAQEIFDKLQIHDSLSWNALMVGYAQLGDGQKVLTLFNEMIAEGIDPEPGVVTIVLSACNQSGYLSRGQLYFESIVKKFNIMPCIEHYTCFISLLGSAGHFEKSLSMIEAMPFPVDLTIWHTLLVACQKMGSSKLAKWAFDHAVLSNDEDAAAYVFTSNTADM
ncbi:hypothetical protein KP509_21G004200 [Ceratopteris richardii]|uniref:Pentatricopeptide repeat-containing protein n=1 Tax=Ceratopteris richardii TaxID=49495 RepID=A0A8T2SAD8_CERRI|nr:hypothetical protein KP509_21G004200 [Ceratopteris richardii]